MSHPFAADRREVRRRRTMRVRASTAALLVAGCGLVAAETDAGAEAKRLQLSGFGSLGVAHVNAPSGVGFQRDDTERANHGGTRADIDSRLGLQANYRASLQFEWVGQVVAANRRMRAPESDFVTLAFAAWRPTDDITVRAGRMGTDYYLLADYRNVGFAYPFARPPVENYASVPYLLDGLDVTKAWRFNETVWKLRGITGRSRLGNDQSNNTLYMRPIYSLVLSGDDLEGLSFKASITRVRLHTDNAGLAPLLMQLGAVASLPDAGVADEARHLASVFDFDDHAVTFSSVGVNFDRGGWLASVEISRCEPQKASAYTSAWGIVGHRWGAFTAYGGMSAIHTEQRRTPPQWAAALTPLVGAAAAAQAQQLGTLASMAATGTNANQRTSTLGVRWDFYDRMALKVQWDRIHVDANATRFWTTPARNEPIHANVGSVVLDFVF